jgi:hypothetical protein
MSRSLFLLFLTAASVAVLRGDEGMWTFDNPPRALIKPKYGFDLTDAWLEAAIAAGPPSIRVLRTAGSPSMVPDMAVYPDANSTLRLAYGTVLGYEEDSTLVPFKTTAYGLYERAAAFDDKEPFTAGALA